MLLSPKISAPRQALRCRPATILHSSVFRPQTKRAALPDIIATVAENVPGSVDAPIGVIIGSAVLITIASTLLVPLALNPGQQAADKIFSETRAGTDPLKKKPVAKAKRR